MLTPNTLFSKTTEAGLVAAFVLFGFFLVSPSAIAQTTSSPGDMGSAWTQWGNLISWQLQKQHNDEIMNTDLRLYVYKAAQSQTSGQYVTDVYLVAGPLSQGLLGYTTYTDTSDGYFGKNMSLTLTGMMPENQKAVLYEASPTSTVNTDTTTISLDGSVGAPGAGNLGYSETFSSAGVQIAASANGNMASFTAILATLDGTSVSQSILGNWSALPEPGFPSTLGYSMPLGAVFEVPHPNGALRIDINHSAEWDMFTAGSPNSEINASGSGSFWVDFQNRSIFGSNCMTVQGNIAIAGTPIVETDCNNSQSQLWSYTAASQITVRMGGSIFCLDTINGSPAAVGAKLGIQPCNSNSPSQKWEVSTTTHSNGLTQLRSNSGLVAYGNAYTPRAIGGTPGSIGIIQKNSGPLTLNYSTPDVNAYFDIR